MLRFAAAAERLVGGYATGAVGGREMTRGEGTPLAVVADVTPQSSSSPRSAPHGSGMVLVDSGGEGR